MEELRPKVLALYQAVLKLLDEGADINTIKVSEITRKAGIGKGTAYDYFKSREEIIVSALLYEMDQEMQTERAKLKEYKNFFEKINHAFDWIERRFREQKSFMRVLRLTTQRTEISASILEEYKKHRDFSCRPMTVLSEMCKEGKAAGDIREDIPISAACLASFGCLASFAMYLEGGEYMQDVEPGWMKEFLYTNLLKQLGQEDGIRDRDS